MTIKKLLCIVCALVVALGCVAFAEEDLQAQLDAANARVAELEALVDYAKTYNLRYFAGTTGPDMLTDPAWSTWSALTDKIGFASYMHNTLHSQELRDRNAVYIPFD